MQWISVTCLWGHLTILSSIIYSVLAGRAFPISSENFVIDLFKSINPSIDWDWTNFLVDLSGRYSQCSAVGRRGTFEVTRIHPETKDSIGGLNDYTKGTLRHVKAVNDYLREALPRWVTTSPFQEQIMHAKYFGCSVRPGCQGGMVDFSCCFTPAYGKRVPPPTRPPPTTPRPTLPPFTRPPQRPPRSLAFTKEQYKVAEGITGTPWDSSHFLENLSGTETTCRMVGTSNYDFSYARREAGEFGMVVKGIYGSAPNLGSTQNGIVEVLESWPKVFKKEVGCSVIPDCQVGEGRFTQMYVVVTCIYQRSDLLRSYNYI